MFLQGVAARARRLFARKQASKRPLQPKAGLKKTVSRTVWDSAVIGWNAFTATEAVKALDRLLGDALHVAGNLPYDAAMDAVYNSISRAGGAWHRLFDGGHSFIGAWNAIKDDRPDDEFVRAFGGYLTGLWNDVITPNGLPIMTFSKARLDAVADVLANAGIARDQVYDFVSFTATEAAGGVAGVVILAFNLRKRDPERFYELAGALGVTGAAAANPVLVGVALCAAFLGDQAALKQKAHIFRRLGSASRGAAQASGSLGGAIIGAPLGVIGALPGAIAGAVAMRWLVGRSRRWLTKEATARIGIAAICVLNEQLRIASDGVNGQLAIASNKPVRP